MERGRPARKYSQAARMHDVIRLIEARHGITVRELAEESGVDRRTVYRDLAAIQEAGYPLVADWENGERSYRFLTRFKDVPPISFTVEELMTLHFLRSQLDFLKGSPFEQDIDAIFRKINSVLPPRYAAHLERIGRVTVPLHQGGRDYRKVFDQLKLLREALIYQYRVTMTYGAKGKGSPASYEVDPYTLLFFKGGLYLLGYAHNRKALRTFAIERIGSVEMQRERFEMPEGYLPEEQLRHAFGIVDEVPMRVRLRFSPLLAHLARERLWHPSQQVAEEGDGSATLTFEAGGRMEILSWILSHGRHVEVLEPADLREELRRMIAAMAEMYGGVPGR
ncbi:YafY family protein [Geobacter sp. DSM 9736]|uniref:helix-turn-helix transcriptional regulator n=1 Tax=Geobacter sp. DSM 9736 TaxID=1277350 RepID=UPI000B4FF7DA|nr:transcriptional regulator [Geobacter sp. DSM 9736]SNB46855.1 proteasome accessory factor B [Geobacter sp. DSM 9736]